MRASLPRKHCGCWLSGLRPRGAVLQSAPPAELVSSSLLCRTSWNLHAGAQPLISEACMARSRLLIDLPMARGRCRPRTPLDNFTKTPLHNPDCIQPRSTGTATPVAQLMAPEVLQGTSFQPGTGHPCGPVRGPIQASPVEHGFVVDTSGTSSSSMTLNALPFSANTKGTKSDPTPLRRQFGALTNQAQV